MDKNIYFNLVNSKYNFIVWKKYFKQHIILQFTDNWLVWQKNMYNSE